MKISTKGRYAIRVMVDLAMSPEGEFVKVKDIAYRQNISEKYLEQIIGILGRAGILRSARGAKGGYRLAKKASDYTVEEILRLTEGSLAPVACLDDEVNQCVRKANCTSIELWEDLYKLVTEFLQGVTIEELAEREKNKLMGASI